MLLIFNWWIVAVAEDDIDQSSMVTSFYWLVYLVFSAKTYLFARMSEHSSNESSSKFEKNVIKKSGLYIFNFRLVFCLVLTSSMTLACNTVDTNYALKILPPSVKKRIE